MSGTPLLYRIPPFAVAACLAAMLMLLLFAAQLAGVRAKRVGWAGDLGSVEAMASGLLGLLLAFNFSLAQGRFDARQQVLVREANAIGTAYLRCSVLGEEDRAFCRTQFRRYVELQIKVYRAYGRSVEDPEIPRDLADSEGIQNELWTRITRVVRASPTPPNTALMSALNDVIDRDADRRASLRFSVPSAVSLAIIMSCLAWALLLGFSSGVKGTSAPGAWVVVALLVSVVFGVALDFDRPTSGLITTEAAERTMDNLRRSLAMPPVD